MIVKHNSLFIYIKVVICYAIHLKDIDNLQGDLKGFLEEQKPVRIFRI